MSAKTKYQLREELSFFGKRFICRGSSNIRRGLILGFVQLLPCLHEEAWPLCGDDASAKAKSQFGEELILIGKRLVCRGPSNKLRILLRRGIREDFAPNLIRY
ncbi:hypothetical protein Adt_32648 [Abeliophyllum distichum]|uniref:Uncharacterized protein n=1 Tax=Abeliophyllum distichum TaxID=126358 RepID=A0ABD1QU03_9LAMI